MEKEKQINIRLIISLLLKAPPEKVSELTVFIKNYLC